MSCPDCFKGKVHDHGKARGQEEVVHGVRTYVAAKSKTTASNSTIIYLCDAFGLELINNKILADRYSEETGCKVLVPDVIPGGPMPVEFMSWFEAASASVRWFDVAGWFRKLWYVVRLVWNGVPFVIRAHPRKAQADVLQYARAVRAELPSGGKLGICGFCWGGYLSTTLCLEAADPESSKLLIDAQFNAHPSFLKLPGMVVDVIKTSKVPYSCAVASKDGMLGQEMAEKIEVQLRRELGSPEENNYEFVVYKDCQHGFSVRAHDKEGLQGMENAAVQAISWFNKYLN